MTTPYEAPLSDAQDVQTLMQAALELARTGAKHSRTLLFWQEPDGAHQAELAACVPSGLAAVDATGAELAAKRRLIKGDLAGKNALIYRAGDAPTPETDLILDLKLQATAFEPDVSVTRAQQAGVPVTLAPLLKEHAGFFTAAKRVAAFNAYKLPKDTKAGVLSAMVAACAEATPTQDPAVALRDSVRKLLVEHFSAAKGTKRMSAIKASGLEPAFWEQTKQVLGYTPKDSEEPTLGNLAFRMFATALGDAADQTALKKEGGPLAPEATTILRHLADDPRGKEVYQRMVDQIGPQVATLVPAANRTPEALQDLDLLPSFDFWAAQTLLKRAAQGVRADTIAAAAERRSHSRWSATFGPAFTAAAAAAQVLQGAEACKHEVSALIGAKALYEAYVERFWRVDQGYRHFQAARPRVPQKLKPLVEQLNTQVEAAYESYIDNLAIRWQKAIMGQLPYPPADIPAQTNFFDHQVLTLSPTPSQRVAVIICDALRYECGKELETWLRRSSKAAVSRRSRTTAGAMLCTVPSYTQPGMAALLPKGTLQIQDDLESVTLDGAPTAGLANRQKILAAAIPGARTMKAADALDGGIKDAAGAPLLYIYQNTIDAQGDKPETERQVFQACTQAFREVEALVAALLPQGFSHVLITADHGFLYQQEPEGSYLDVKAKSLSDLSSAEKNAVKQGRRFAITHQTLADDALYDLSSELVSFATGATIGFAKGVTRLALKGSGKRFVHGGLSLQEDVVPVVHVRKVAESAAPKPTGALLFARGAMSVTGQYLAFDLYQEEPVSETVLPATVKVGLFAPDPDGQLLSTQEPQFELTSSSASSDERRRMVELTLTDAVDNVSKCILRASRKDPVTGTWTCINEVTYNQDRTFGTSWFG